MPVSVTCDCGKRLTIKDELAGKRVKCPACGVVFAPSNSSSPKSPAPPKGPAAGPSVSAEQPVAQSKADQMGERYHSVSAEPQPVSILGITLLAIFLVLFGGGLAALGTFGMFSGQGTYHGPVMIAIGLSMIAGAIGFWRVQKARVPQSQVGITLVLYDKGLAYAEGERTTIFFWNEIKLATLVKRDGFFAYMSNQQEVVTLACKGGVRIISALSENFLAQATRFATRFHRLWIFRAMGPMS